MQREKVYGRISISTLIDINLLLLKKSLDYYLSVLSLTFVLVSAEG